MRRTYSNVDEVAIAPRGQGVVTSAINVPDGGLVLDVDIAVLIEHTYVGDLVLVLTAPSGENVVLANRVRGSADDYNRTVFDDEAASFISSASGDALGTFRPTQPLAEFDGIEAAGTWELSVFDLADRDGGRLQAWAMAIDIGQRPGQDRYRVAVDFDGGLTARQREVFATAAARWESIITEPLIEMRADSQRTTTGVVISARGVSIDGPRGTLGQAGPTRLRPGSELPYLGIMEFDTADLAQLEQSGELESVIIHEMGHVLGIGTIWDRFLIGRGGPDPRYIGQSGNERWRAAGGTDRVPIANTGGPGTREGHWRESILGNELMTGFISGAEQPLSAITIGALDDLGYDVDFNQADPYVIPTPDEVAALGLESPAAFHCTACQLGRFPGPIIGPPEDIV